MKINKLFAVAYTIVVFALGAVFAFIFSFKQQIDAVVQPERIQKSIQTSAKRLDKADSNATQEIPTKQVIVHECEKLINANTHTKAGFKKVSLQNYSAEEAKSIIDNMPDVVLSQYVDKFMAKGSSDVIINKREFAQRAIEELYSPNDNQPLSGDIKLSFDSRTPTQSINTDKIPKNSKIYAHLNTYGKTPQSRYVFVKWVDNSTGQVLLFEKKNIVDTSNTNWVNMKPYDGWHAGSYDIRFYQFTSKLEPIAQLTYQIGEVEE